MRLPLLPAAALVAARALAAQSPVRLELVDTAVLRSPRLVESSGVTPSTRRPGVLWTHNDSGDEPRLYATDSAGDDLGSILVAGARNVDWEDLGSGPCPGSPRRCLYPADIGDNFHTRHQIVLYRIAEPEPPAGPADTLRSVPLEAATTLRYPDHAHDAEAIVVDPTGRIFIITKEALGRPRMYRVPPRSAAQPQGTVDTLRPVGELDVQPNLALLRVVTGAAVSPDGVTLVVRTYSSLHFFRLRGDSLPAPLTPATGLLIPFVEPQGEGIAFLAPDLLVLTSERGNADHGTVARIRVVGLPGAAP
ncbi:MAG TPA: hypothetical protein VEH62_15590 [Gemmatimonadales bacterium]|nr:hypothetical protein [Gemmatimonadales bacterium]